MNQKTRFLKFCIVGGIGTVFNLVVLFFLVEYLYIGKSLAWIIAFIGSVLNNFILNSIYTYKDRKAQSHKENGKRMLNYYITSLSVMIFNFAIYKSLLLVNFHYMIAAFLGILLSSILNFILANKLVWNEVKCSVNN